jgi:hypothetical protein
MSQSKKETRNTSRGSRILDPDFLDFDAKISVFAADQENYSENLRCPRNCIYLFYCTPNINMLLELPSPMSL